MKDQKIKNFYNTNKNYLFWFDLEMTGLNVNTCHILEISIIITDIKLNIINKISNIVIYQNNNILSTMNDFCKKIHKNSGLITDVKNSIISLYQAEKIIIEFITPYLKSELGIMCGNSIWQDRKFIDKYMKNLSSYFHYRVFDVSTMKIASFLWNDKILSKIKKKNMHRSLDDIIDSIKEMKNYLIFLLKIE